jgi:hypothetical protein
MTYSSSMNKYKWGIKTFYAWSEMGCRNEERHEPHSWDGQHTVYGPYMCWGHPLRKEPDLEDIRNATSHILGRLSWMREALEESNPEVAKAFESLERFALGGTEEST